MLSPELSVLSPELSMMIPKLSFLSPGSVLSILTARLFILSPELDSERSLF